MVPMFGFSAKHLGLPSVLTYRVVCTMFLQEGADPPRHGCCSININLYQNIVIPSLITSEVSRMKVFQIYIYIYYDCDTFQI